MKPKYVHVILAEARRKAGLSLAQLVELLEAEDLFTTRQQCSEWELGKVEPRASALLAWLRACGVKRLDLR